MMSKQTTWGTLPAQPTLDMEEEFMLLMSLRLDDLLDEAELQQFNQYVSRYAVFAKQWREWQQLHLTMQAAPHAEPSSTFLFKVEQSLVQQHRRSQLWRGLLFGSVIICLWIGLLVTTVGLGAYLMFNQGGWLTQLLYNLAYYSSAMTEQLELVRTTFDSVVVQPQTPLVGVAYVSLSVVLLSAWVRILRRTTANAVIETEATSV